jgi:hypothetical protein
MTSSFFPVPARTIAQAAAAAEMKTVDCPNVICMARQFERSGASWIEASQSVRCAASAVTLIACGKRLS